jgi:hypothetical protein
MNRIVGLASVETLPRPSVAFTDAEALELLIAYRRDPSDLSCPLCGPGCMEVLGFIEPHLDDEGFANVKAPAGDYAVALYCHTCSRAIGILPRLL